MDTTTTSDLRLTAEECRAAVAWFDEHGYLQTPHETLEEWRQRTAPVAYLYALLLDAAEG